jgi:protein O-mannosyl-transferase
MNLKYQTPQPASISAPIKSALWVSLVLIMLNLFIYAPASRYGFLTWDDPLYVTQNSEVLRGLTWQGFQWAFTTGSASNWHPLTWLSHMLDVQLYGRAAGFHHLTSILLHIANSVLLFWAIYRMTGSWRPSAFVAALFAVHPMHVESVAWIAERKDVLSTFFCMLTFHAYIRYIRKPHLNRYLILAVVFALGLMSKPMLVTLPFLLLLLDVWPLRRAKLEAGQGRVWLCLLSEKIPLLVLTAASSMVTIAVQWRGGTVISFTSASFGRRIANALVSYTAYVAKMFWPADLVAYYPYNTWPFWLVSGSFLALIATTFIAVRFARKHPYILVVWLWYLGTLLPVIGLIQVGGQAMADRYTYVPFIGLFIIVAWSAPLLLGRWRYKGIALLSAAAIVICSLSAAARNQVGYWKNDLALWTHTVARRGDYNFIAHTMLGYTWENLGEVTFAVREYTEALRIYSEIDSAHLRLGLIRFSQGQFGEALTHYNHAIRINPNLTQAYISRGILRQVQGEVAQAIEDFRAALRVNPDDAESHHNLGRALVNEGKMDEAIAHLNEAVRLTPNNANARNDLGYALSSQRKIGEAIFQYTRAVSIEPDFWEAHANLGIALVAQGRDSEALGHFMEALRINPDLAQIHNSVGIILKNQGRKSEAISHLKEAVRLSPDSVKIRENLESAIAGQ